jgi:hypothetical protein
MLTTEQYILHELEASEEPLTLKELFISFKVKNLGINSVELYQNISKLVDDGWVEYYGLTRTSNLGYLLCNRWYNLSESEREKKINS